jgi:NAD(P)-dependent dehydrogenase (short-subunit alcohol dehydrogenase family)
VKTLLPVERGVGPLEYAANKIRFNTVSPAVINTPMPVSPQLGLAVPHFVPPPLSFNSD